MFLLNKNLLTNLVIFLNLVILRHIVGEDLVRAFYC